MQKEICHFVTNSQRCQNTRGELSPFCSEHKDYFSNIDNQSLLKRAAQSVRECIHVKDKKIAAQLDMGIWGNYTNHLNELTARGYKPEEVMTYLREIIETEGILDDVFKELGNKDPKWKRFEKILAGIHLLKAEGAKVKFNDHVTGKRTHGQRQIDVSLKFNNSYYEYFAIIECKDYKTKVPIKDVEAFHTKMEDVGAQKGIMVSRKGFQAGALKTAEAYGIELFTLTEEMTEWTKTIKKDVMYLPFPKDITFQHPSIDKKDQPDATGKDIAFRDILFYKDKESPPISLHQIILDVCSWAYRKKLVLPCIVDLKFPSEFFTQFPGATFYTPVFGLDIRLENVKCVSSREIDTPPQLTKYIYSNATKDERYEIPANELPIGVDTVIEPGKYYTNRLNIIYRCFKLEENKFHMMAFDLRPLEGNGPTVSVEVTLDIKQSSSFIPFEDAEEIRRLEKRYQSMRKGK